MHADVLEILRSTNPSFQLKSGLPELQSTEKLFAAGGAVDTGSFTRASHALPMASLRALSAVLKPEHTTLEVGGGQSTVVFAAEVKRHYCVNPDATSNELIGEFLRAHGFSSDNVVFLTESSDLALPRLEIDGIIDVALLDGSHSFPFPMIDWHYVDRFLRRGSVLILDNVEINAVRILAEFLMMESSYRLVSRVTNSHRYDCFVFEKTQDSSVSGWGDQGLNRAILGRLFVHSVINRFWKHARQLRGMLTSKR